ncbi:MAG TPA: A24 family peptidase [Bryobacteraceae bacterium]|nr:A24 family peptidase [Bryobacteraceae bacterium]
MRSIAWWPTLLVLAVAMFTDLRSRRIPNWLVLPFLAAGLAASTLLHGGRGLLSSLEGALLAAALLGVFFLSGGMGAGDLKLCAAIGAWIWPEQLAVALILTAIAGGFIAVARAAAGGFLKESLAGTGRLLFGGKRSGSVPALDSPLARTIPYAPAIAIGTILSFFGAKG